VPSQPGFNLPPTFFGFKPKDRLILHENIFNLIWHGEGRWDWDTVYNWPVFLRNYYSRRVNQILKDRQDQIKENQKKIGRK